MQPVLLGRSFAPLQGEMGLRSAEIPSNHQTTGPSKEHCGGKKTKASISLCRKIITALVLKTRCLRTVNPDSDPVVSPPMKVK